MHHYACVSEHGPPIRFRKESLGASMSDGGYLTERNPTISGTQGVEGAGWFKYWRGMMADSLSRHSGSAAFHERFRRTA